MLTSAVECPAFTVSSQNCNSLNLTGLSTNLEMKLEAVTATKSDFIFLSDIRLVNTRGVKGSERVSRYLRDNKNRAYEMHHHSTGNGRGVAILIAISLNVIIEHCWKDQAEIAIIMDVTLDNCKLTLGAVYGPNNTGREFYRFLRETLAVSSGTYKILGGDWNTVGDTRPPQYNIDIINMVSVPNVVNSNLLEELCTDLMLSDPFRTLYPTRIDFKYTPFGLVRNSRRGIHFFMVSNNLIPMLDDCTISPTVTASLFDHKCIGLYVKKNASKKNKVPKLTNTFLNSKYLDLSVTAAAIEVNVLAIDESCNENLPANYNSLADLVTDMKQKLVDLKRIIKELESLELQKAKSDQDVHLNLLVAAKAASGFFAIENMIPMGEIEKMKKRCSHSRFFEILVEQTKKMGMRAQKKLSYNEFVRKNEIRSQIENLKKIFGENQDVIFDLERDLGRIIDNELRDRMMDLKVFDCLHAEKATSHFLNIAKKTSKGESLEKIRKPDGTEFGSA
jgi:hypothetical protein